MRVPLKSVTPHLLAKSRISFFLYLLDVSHVFCGILQSSSPPTTGAGCGATGSGAGSGCTIPAILAAIRAHSSLRVPSRLVTPHFLARAKISGFLYLLDVSHVFCGILQPSSADGGATTGCGSGATGSGSGTGPKR